ncbi:dethiobiotin synthase [Vampirovibrio sp.]|uniref:dethiobiotin synthase n=1 Tax=Vampirovibrio sp. TaxID=2717857 RepID=UPI00359462FE
MSLFITGTDTGVGKTVLTAGLAALLKSRDEPFCVFKPIQTGCPDPAHPEDPEQVKQWVGDSVETFCSYCFPLPVAPYAADPERTIQPRKILQDFKALQAQHKTVLVEGAGGIRVPIANRFEMLDLARMLQLPVVVVARPNLGTINHTLLTVETLLRQRLEVKGVVISGWKPDDPDPSVPSLAETLENFLPVPLLGLLPVLPQQAGSFNAESVRSAFAALNLI